VGLPEFSIAGAAGAALLVRLPVLPALVLLPLFASALLSGDRCCKRTA